MGVLVKFLFWISLGFILWHNIFYYVFLLLSVPKRRKKELRPYEFPFVSYIVPVYNEEVIIKEKILNVFDTDYPREKIELIVVSDASNDRTEEIVKSFQPDFKNIKLLRVEKRIGKVNAQNEAVKIANGEILAFSDVNTFWQSASLRRLIEGLNKESIALVCGKINYVEDLKSEVSYSESLYWKFENKLKKLESDFYSLSAINGGIYAMKMSDYIFLDPIYSHDLCLPQLLAKERKRTIFLEEALAFEKSGSSIEGEIKRKIRMFSRTYNFMFKNLNLFFNPFMYNFRFLVAFFSHRILRYTLPLWHFLLFLSSMVLIRSGLIFPLVFYSQLLFFASAILGYLLKKKSGFLYFLFYYLFFLYSMVLGFLVFVSGRTKSFWESSIETRGGLS